MDPIQPDHIVKLMNVDYYLDWQEQLPSFRPFILYTFTPDSPAGTADDYIWHTNADNTVTVTMGGGAVYHHELHDYSDDKAWCRHDGILYSYKLERVRVSRDWSFILLNPFVAYRERGRDQHSIPRRQLTHSCVTLATSATYTKDRVMITPPHTRSIALTRSGSGASLLTHLA